MTYAGLDTDQFPGIPVLDALARETNIAWVGYYLPAPSHSNAGWSGNRAAILNLGLAVVPIYVGQQTQGPGSHIVTGDQGVIDGNDAGAKMYAEGFPARSYIYLDLENGAPFTEPQAEYVQAWCLGVRGSGYAPGVYCSHAMAADVAAKITFDKLRLWCFRVPTTDRTTATAPFPTPDPSGCGYANAVIWQRQDNVQISGAGYSLVVDLDTSTLRDPGAPIAAVPAPLAPTPVSVSTSLAPVSAPTLSPPAPATAPPLAGATTVALPPMVDFTPPAPVTLPNQVVAQVQQLGTHGAAYLAGILGTWGLIAPGDEQKLAGLGGSLAVMALSIGVNALLQYYRHQQAKTAVAVAKAS